MTEEPTAQTKTLKPEQQRVIDDLKALQERSKGVDGKARSDGEFTKDMSVASSTWNLIKHGLYFAERKEINVARVIENLRTDLGVKRRKMAISSRFGAMDFIEVADFESIFSAIDECSTKPLSDPDRYIAYLAQTGGGKSALCAEVMKRFNGEMIEATAGWRKSRYHATRGIAEEIGVTGWNQKNDPDWLTKLILQKLNEKNIVLAIDEGEYVGKEVLELFRLILNRTPTVILHCSNPGPYDALETYYPHQFEQIQRRTHLLIRQKAITPETVRDFIKPIGLNGLERDACTLIAKAANSFGRYDFVKRMTARLADSAPAGKGDIEKAISTEKARMGKVAA